MNPLSGTQILKILGAAVLGLGFVALFILSSALKEDPMHLGFRALPWIIAILACLAVYLLPTLIARSRAHHNLALLVVMNIVLGWTGIGWLALLIYAFANPPMRQPVQGEEGGNR